jgi:RNA polymerase sigma factor (sigma-70 family)
MPGRESDADVIAASRHAPSRFAIVFDRHFDAIYAFLRRRIGPQAAEDLAAHTFEQAFRLRGRYDQAYADARPWLYGIATNLLRNQARDERRRFAAYARAGVDAATPDDSDRAVSRADADAHAGTLARALTILSDAERDALLLLAWGQLSYGEIARALGVPVGTVRSRLSRARSKVRELLRGSGQGLEGDDRVLVPEADDGHR